MFKLVIFFAFVAVVYGAPDRPVVNFKPAVVADIKKALDECGTPKYHGSILEQMTEQGKYYDDAEYQTLVHCVYVKSGYAKPDGTVDLEKCSKEFPDSEAMLKFMKTCEHNTGNAEADTFSYYKCFLDKSPVLMSFH